MAKQEKKEMNKLSRWFGSHTASYIIIFVASIALFGAAITLYMSLKNTRNELQSCRSSCSSSAE